MRPDNLLPKLRVAANEDGSIIVIALLLLMLLSLVVIAGSRTSAVEVMIAANKKASERVFYLADGLAHQAARVIENQSLAAPEVLRDAAGWDAGGLAKENNVPAQGGGVVDTTATGRWEGGGGYAWLPTPGVAVPAWPNMAGWGDADGDGVSDNPRDPAVVGAANGDRFEYLIVDKGISEGASLDTSSGGSSLREYNLRGRVQSGSVNDEVSLGYKVRVSNN